MQSTETFVELQARLHPLFPVKRELATVGLRNRLCKGWVIFTPVSVCIGHNASANSPRRAIVRKLNNRLSDAEILRCSGTNIVERYKYLALMKYVRNISSWPNLIEGERSNDDIRAKVAKNYEEFMGIHFLRVFTMTANNRLAFIGCTLCFTAYYTTSRRIRFLISKQHVMKMFGASFHRGKPKLPRNFFI